MANNSEKFSKLPELAKPFLYEICMAASLETFKFSGKEKIHLEITKPTNYLKLHSNALQVEKASLKLADGTVLGDLKREIDNKWALLTLHLPNEVGPQKAELELEFKGDVQDDMMGFYKSCYKDDAGQEQFLLSTQFESTYARKAFPCWDEPLYKAQFDIQFVVREDLTVLSNMPVVEERSTDDGKKRVTFARTPLMSTYLVAFAIGHLEYIEAQSQIGCAVRCYSVPGKREQCEYALEVAVKAIDWYSNWFGINMPLPKCDLIALPDFAMGAMENWGLITFREQFLLMDQTKTSSAHKQRITLVIAHEVGHFWFGNLVTMEWWSDLWLKEGFASFMEYVFTDEVYPEFKVWMGFLNAELVRGMELDSMRNAHPIEVPIDNPNDLEEIYDAITYQKSNSVIRMLYNHLGEPTFQNGLRIYLQRHKYANAVTEDLWASLSEASGIDVNGLMSSWTKQMGFPLISVESVQLEGQQSRELHVQQTRFLADGGKDASNPVWQVPIGVSGAGEVKEKYLLVKQEDKFVVNGVNPEQWIKLNPGFTSFFRVQYSKAMFSQLLAAIKAGEMNALDRFQMADDLFSLVSSTRIPASQFLEFLDVCRDEDNYFVWCSIDSGLAELDHVIAHSDNPELVKSFHRYVCSVIEPVAARYGWVPKEGEDMHTGRLRALLLSRLARCQHSPTIATAQAKFDDHAVNDVDLVPELRGAIYGAVARANSKVNMEALEKILETCNFSEVERNCIIALGQCSSPELLERVYQRGVVEGKIRGQDLFYLFMATASSNKKECQSFLWDYFKKNMKLLLDKYGGSVNSGLFQDCLKSSSEGFCSAAMAQEVEQFCKDSFDQHSLKTLDRVIRQIVESITLKENFLKNNERDLVTHMHKVGFLQLAN